MRQQSQHGRQTQQCNQTAGTPIIVDVHARPGCNGIDWSHKWRFENGPSKGGGAIEVPKSNGETPMHFHLRDETGLHLRFVSQASDAMWVSRGGCPDARCVDAEIRYGTQPANKLLKVQNMNSEECTLHFALRFEGDNGEECYDPEIKNGVGTSS